ncbi:MAG: hypothetical protein QW568_02125 [Candidatus Anstonellaceae archaeon]
MKKKEEVCYVCKGTCGAVISEARYKAGLKKCGAEGCTMHGKPFKKEKMSEKSGCGCSCC